MKKIIPLMILLTANLTNAQVNNKKGKENLLPKAEAVKVFTPDVKTKLGITLPVVRTYSYTDKNGKYYMVLTEKFDGLKDGDTVHKTIKAFNFESTAAGPEKQWEINDAANKATADYDGERSIWFWTRYCMFQDIDKDGLADPIIVYGTSGSGGYDEGRGRVKILIYYRGNKIVLRHQDGVLDDERNTQLDAAFYKLPKVIQNEVVKIMHDIEVTTNTIFPNGWEANMKKQKLEISESN
jgi:hypothetical protein